MTTEVKEITKEPARQGGVQSIGRAFLLLETIADNAGVMGLSQLASASGLPLPTIHRLVRTLVDLGYLRQDAARQYVLAPRLIRLGESSSRLLSVWARPHLARLVEELGESANVAMLDGNSIVYVAQVPSQRSMRMFTEVGRRVLPHCTAVGKAILAQQPPETVRQLLADTGMPSFTHKTITDPDDFLTALEWCAERGYAIDEEEQEIGVRCVAVAVPDVSGHLALSLSGPAGRMSEQMVRRAVPLLQRSALELSRDLS